jgi:hypothetical protein
MSLLFPASYAVVSSQNKGGGKHFCTTASLQSYNFEPFAHSSESADLNSDIRQRIFKRHMIRNDLLRYAGSRKDIIFMVAYSIQVK